MLVLCYSAASAVCGTLDPCQEVPGRYTVNIYTDLFITSCKLYSNMIFLQFSNCTLHIHREYIYIPFSILHPVSARDTNISQRAEGPRADIVQGPMQSVIWKIIRIIIFITYLQQ